MLQKYIERPMLINKRKFDIRVWALVTQDLDLFWFREGYIRTASGEYQLDKNDEFVHLTNNAIQRQCPQYGLNEEGNQLSFHDFRSYCKKELQTDFDKDILP